MKFGLLTSVNTGWHAMALKLYNGYFAHQNAQFICSVKKVMTSGAIIDIIEQLIR